MSNKLTISANGNRFSLDISNPEKVASLFWLLVKTLIPETDTEPIAVVNSSASTPIVAEEAVEGPMQIDNPARRNFGKGFLHIKCENCGKAKGFNTKYDIDRFYCKDCDTTTVFTDPLVHVRFNCECGSNFRYHTNIDDDMFDINCLDCQSPVTVEYNGKAKEYRGGVA